MLLVEVAAPLEAARLLGGPPSRGRETEALPGLFTLNLDPQAVMDEYVRHVVKLDLSPGASWRARSTTASSPPPRGSRS